MVMGVSQQPGKWMKYQDGIFEFFGDLSSSPFFVLCKLRRVLFPKFGDLIFRICSQKTVRFQVDSEREKRRSRDSLRLSEVLGRITSSGELRVSQKIQGA
jgi:hypothetical protein